MRPRDESKPVFNAKSLAALLAGDNQCRWAVWVGSRYYYRHRRGDFNLKAWKEAHNDLVNRRVEELRAQGYTVKVEDQNRLMLEGKQAFIKAKPDLVATKPGEALISDEKTGKDRETDFWQVLVYGACLELKDPETFKAEGTQVYGEIVYSGGGPGIMAFEMAKELTDERRAKIFGLVRELATTIPPTAVPSELECRYCDVDECTVRMGTVAPTQVTEF